MVFFSNAILNTGESHPFVFDLQILSRVYERVYVYLRKNSQRYS